MDHISTSPISVLLPIYRHALILSQKKSISLTLYYLTDRKLELDFGDGKSSYITNKGQCLVINKHCYVFNNPEEKECFIKTQSLKMDNFELPKQKEGIIKDSLPNNKIEMTVSLSERSKRKERHISFGTVSEREYDRQIGGSSAVPLEGSWPLGLSWKYTKKETISVEEFEERKEKIISDRIFKLPNHKKQYATGETRQLCHRSKPNPIFTFLTEKQRKELFIKYYTDDDSESNDDDSNNNSLISIESDNNHECIDLNNIRESRQNVGCNCKSIHRHKLSNKKKMEFLKLWNVEVKKGDDINQLYNDNLSKNNKQCLHNCPCEMNGIECHYLVCNCCDKKIDCENKFGFHNYDENIVKQFRYSVLNRLNT